ncbi:MAG TPA: hypothetical protein VJM50_23520 [Pyrinomonadaceae bacterium]|nr:hypothetical protein [Pyrinomonadaceae bacterium]
MSGLAELYVRDDRSTAPSKGLSDYAFAEAAAPVCDPATKPVETLSSYIEWLNNELRKGAQRSATRLAAKRRLVALEAEAIVRSLDAFILAGCCEPALKTLESQVRALPWPAEAAPVRIRLLSAIIAAQGRARKNVESC